MNLNDYLHQKVKNKSILILGYGREGRSTYKILSKFKDVKITIADKNTEIKENCNLILGDNYLDTIDEFDMVFKSPGISIGKSHNNITSQMQIFTELFYSNMIGITGTKGKSTTTSLVYHILKSCNLDARLGGNIGLPVFDICDNTDKNTIFVVEMSAHQLELMNVSPHIATINNLYEEHLDYYGSYNNYIEAKKNIGYFQKNTDYLIINDNISIEINSNKIKAGYNINDDIYTTDNSITINNKIYTLDDKKLTLKGKHNIYNIGIAIYISKLYKLSDEEIINSLYSYKPLSHRLEFIGRFQNIDFYDDSISTIPSTTISAINAISNTETIIIGGMDRGISYLDLEKFIIEHINYKYILMGKTGKRIYDEIDKKTDNIYIVRNLNEAVNKAFEITNKNMAVIMSPAAASYDEFKNFEDRGDKFKEFVFQYK